MTFPFYTYRLSTVCVWRLGVLSVACRLFTTKINSIPMAMSTSEAISEWNSLEELVAVMSPFCKRWLCITNASKLKVMGSQAKSQALLRGW